MFLVSVNGGSVYIARWNLILGTFEPSEPSVNQYSCPLRWYPTSNEENGAVVEKKTKLKEEITRRSERRHTETISVLIFGNPTDRCVQRKQILLTAIRRASSLSLRFQRTNFQLGLVLHRSPNSESHSLLASLKFTQTRWIREYINALANLSRDLAAKWSVPVAFSATFDDLWPPNFRELPLVYPRRTAEFLHRVSRMQSVGLHSSEFPHAATMHAAMRSRIKITNTEALCAAPAVSQTASERKENPADAIDPSSLVCRKRYLCSYMYYQIQPYFAKSYLSL